METKHRRGGKYAAPRTPRKATRGEKKKKARPFGGRELLLLLLPALAAVTVVAIALFAVDQGSTYTFNVSGTQYYAGTASPVLRGSQLKIQEDGTTALTRQGQTTVSSLPVYLDDSPELVLTADMLYFTPRSDGCHRAVHFSHFLLRDNHSILVTQDNRSVTPQAGFLYDGQDLFVFLEPVTVRYHGRSVELPALSYVEAVYGGDITIFNYETKKSIVEPSDGSGLVIPKAGDYELSLLGDSMTLPNGNRRLLVTRPDIMDPMT